MGRKLKKTERNADLYMVSLWEKMKKNKTAYLFIMPSMLIVLLLSLGPIFYGVGLSFTNYNQYVSGEISVQSSYKEDITQKQQEIKNEKDPVKAKELKRRFELYKAEQVMMIDNEKIDQLKRYRAIYLDDGDKKNAAKMAAEAKNVERMMDKGKVYQPLKFVGFANFIAALKADSEFFGVILKTILWTIINLVLQVTVGVFVAILLNRVNRNFKGIFRSLLILPWIMPQLITCLVWKALFNSEFGFINVMLGKIAGMLGGNGNVQIAWLQSPTIAFIAVIIVNVWIGIPFITLTATGALQSIPEEIFESVAIDGCNGFQKLIYITVPLIKTAMMPAILMGTIWTFNCFNVPYLITEIGANTPVYLVANYMFKVMRSGTYNLASAYSIIVFLILLLITIINIRVSKTFEEE